MKDKQKAIHAALEGPEKQQLEVYGHKWNVKPASVRKEGNRVIVEGQISHSVRWTFDDQIFYTFVFEDQKLVKNDIKIEERGWAELSSPIVSAVSAYFGKPIPPEDVSKIGDMLEGVAYGKWEEAVQGLAMDIAMKGYERMYGVTAYTEPNFKGKYQTFTPGVYEAKDFWAVGNDRISSIRVPHRMRVEACDHRPGVGKPEECQIFTSDRPNVSPLNGISYLYVEDLDHPHHTIVVDGTKSKRTEYDIEVSGWLSHNAQKGSIQHNDKISRDRKRVHGIVGGGKDAFNFKGDVKKITLKGDKNSTVIKVDGSKVDVE